MTEQPIPAIQPNPDEAVTEWYADEHGLRRCLPEHAIERALASFRWHEFTPWSAPHLKPYPPTEDACGSCGKPEGVHPIPWAPIDGYVGGALLVTLGLADSGQRIAPPKSGHNGRTRA